MGSEEGCGKAAAAIPLNPTPWLVFDHWEEGYTFSTAFLDNKLYYLKDSPGLKGKMIVASRFGWLILLEIDDEDEDCYYPSVWNPVTSETINLPPVCYHHDPPRPERWLLSSSPTDDNCFIFFIVLGRVFVCRCHGDSRHWFSEKIEVEGDRAFVVVAVALNKIIYCFAVDHTTGDKSQLISIQVIAGANDNSGSYSLDIKYLSISLPTLSSFEVLGSHEEYIVESCGTIYIAHVGMLRYGRTHHVEVWELNLEHQVAVLVTSLGDCALFLADHGNTWSWASTDYGVQRNCIYLFDADLSSDAVILYNLEDCTSTYLPCPRLRDPCRSIAFWMMPQLPSLLEERPNCKKCIDKYDLLPKSSCLVDSMIEKNKVRGEYLTRLPNDLIQLLTKYMHLFDYWNFRCTSKMIRSVTPAPEWRTNNVLPLFLVMNDVAGSCQLIDPCRNDYFPCVLQFSHEFLNIEFSKEGWLLILDGEHLQFFNPFTRERRVLPPHNQRFHKIGFSTQPTCSKCLTLTIYSWDGPTFINYHRYGEKTWKTRCFDNTQNIDFCWADATPVYHSGAFYFLDKSGYLGVLEWVNEDFTWRVYNQHLAKVRDVHSCHLVKHREELLAVVIDKLGKFVSVFRFNFSKGHWIGVKSLGNHVLFISPYSSSSVPTEDIKMYDRIYLPWMKEQHIVYYSLKTLRYHVDDDGGDYSRLDFFHFKNPSWCCWI